MQMLFLFKVCSQDVWHIFLVQLVTEMSLCPTQCFWVGNQLEKCYQKIPYSSNFQPTLLKHTYTEYIIWNLWSLFPKPRTSDVVSFM